MNELIESYEAAWTLVAERITELNGRLRTQQLRNRERERMTARRDMLVTERAELAQTLRELRQHGKEDADEPGAQAVSGAA